MTTCEVEHVPMPSTSGSSPLAAQVAAARRSRPASAGAASPARGPSAKRRRVLAASQSAAQQASVATAAPKAKATAATQASPGPDGGMWLVVGLGNPGANYDDTRHNIGFKVVDELARLEAIDCRKLEKSAAVGKGSMEGFPVILCKPVTFMNNSGESVSQLAKFYRVPTSRVLVIADDLDLPLGTVRLRAKGGHGGHNGLRSIIDRLGGSQEFPRIKIGIGRPSGSMPVSSFVLQEFTKSERPEMDVAVQEAITVIRSILRLGMEKATSGQRV